MKRKLKGVLSAALLLLLLVRMSQASDLIEPTRTLQGMKNATGSLTILSEPPNLSVTLDDTLIGKTPIFLNNVQAGIHTLRVEDSETIIDVKPDATLKISLFRGKFINIPVEKKESAKPQVIPGGKDKETRAIRTPPKEEKKNELTPWKKYLDGTSDHF